MGWKVIDDEGRLAPSLVMLIILFAYVFGVACGYWIRMQLETRAELAVVLDDEKKIQQIERETEEALRTHGIEMENIRSAPVADCYRNPLPDSWFGVQPGISEAE